MDAQQTQKFAEQIHQMDLFRHGDLAVCQRLVSVMHHQIFNAGTILFEKGAPGDSMYLILRGCVRIYIEDDQSAELSAGSEEETSGFSIRRFKAPSTLGELAMIDSKPRSTSAITEEETEVLILHRADFMDLMRKNPAVGLMMMRDLVDRVRYTTDFLQQVMRATTELSQGNYNLTLEDDEVSERKANIQGLINAFLKMVQSIQAREQQLTQNVGANQD